MKKELKASVSIDMKNILKRTKEFGKEFEELCYKYGLAPDMAKNEENNDVYFVVSVKDLINEKDIDISLK